MGPVLAGRVVALQTITQPRQQALHDLPSKVSECLAIDRQVPANCPQSKFAMVPVVVRPTLGNFEGPLDVF